MQQKEVLIIVGVLVVGFFLLNNNGMLSGQATYITHPDPYEGNDAYAEQAIPPMGPGTGSAITPCYDPCYYEVNRLRRLSDSILPPFDYRIYAHNIIQTQYCPVYPPCAGVCKYRFISGGSWIEQILTCGGVE